MVSDTRAAQRLGPTGSPTRHPSGARIPIADRRRPSYPELRPSHPEPRPSSLGPDETTYEHGGDPGRDEVEKVGVLVALNGFPMLAAGFRAAIEDEPDMEVVGDVESLESLDDALDREDVDIVITEVQPLNGCGRMTIDTIERIRTSRPRARIIALECGASGDQFSLALKAGADGFLTREAEVSDVITAIHCVARGQTYVSPTIVTKMVNSYVLKSSPGGMDDPYETLSDREKEVLLLAATGHTNREIAKIFHLSEQTVHNYRAGLMEKLGLHDRVELLKFAIRRGVIDVADL